ncbi:MAG: alpha/beta fold hydrolase [Myxococcota bacterium]
MADELVEASDGTPLYVEVHGQGVPFVLSCAFCTTHENWRAQVAPLTAAGAKLVLWDYRGHGRSGAPADPGGYSMDQVVDDLRRVVDATCDGQPAVLGGLSFGGLCSLHFTLRHRERVRALVLVDSGPGFKNPEALAGWTAQVERTARFLEERGFRAFVDGRAGATCVGREPDLPAARAAGDAIAAQDAAAVAAFGRRVAGPAPPVIDALPDIDVPALVLVGEEDRPYLRAADVMAAKLPRAEKVVIPGAGHIVNIEAAERFDAEVVRFLKERVLG